MTQPKTDLAYLRSEKAKAEQKLRSCQHREKILERRMSELNRRERVGAIIHRSGEIAVLQTARCNRSWRLCASPIPSQGKMHFPCAATAAILSS